MYVLCGCHLVRADQDTAMMKYWFASLWTICGKCCEHEDTVAIYTVSVYYV